jgi:hypothetical protein
MPVDVRKLRSDFQRASAEGKIDGVKARRLIRDARAHRLTESEANTFKREVARHEHDLTKDGKKVIDGFIANTMKKIEILDATPKGQVGPLRDPAVLKADKQRLEQQVVKGGQLFRHGVSGSDPEQNYIGDCYLMAAMSAVAKSSPDVIEKMFKKLKNGKYAVTLWDKKGDHMEKHVVVIDSDLPRNGWYGYYYARAKDPKELWPALLEKAFAVRAGSYHKIEAGIPGEAMAAITGKMSNDIDLRAKGTNADEVFAQLEAAVKASKPATAATLSDSSAAKYKGTNIYTDHTYTVWGTSTENGVKYVHLRNPWGESEPKGNGRDDGVFKIPLAEFMSLYSGVSING